MVCDVSPHIIDASTLRRIISNMSTCQHTVKVKFDSVTTEQRIAILTKYDGKCDDNAMIMKSYHIMTGVITHDDRVGLIY